MVIELNGEDAKGRVISRSVAQDQSPRCSGPAWWATPSASAMSSATRSSWTWRAVHPGDPGDRQPSTWTPSSSTRPPPSGPAAADPCPAPSTREVVYLRPSNSAPGDWGGAGPDGDLGPGDLLPEQGRHCGKEEQTMRNIPELSCAIVEDLLPTHVERLTSEETNMAVEAHWRPAPPVRPSGPLWGEGNGSGGKRRRPPGVDYLKKVRHRGRRRSCGGAGNLAGAGGGPPPRSLSSAHL